jgi:hypothetical protein
MLVENNEDIIIISPWYSWKIAHFGIKQQSLTHYILKLIIRSYSLMSPWYNWNIVESGVKHHKTKPTP